MSESKLNRYVRLPVLLCVLLANAAFAQGTSLISGQNINMVSGTEWPNGDPFLQRQNEPTIAVSTRNELHLMGGSNDYRTVDLPGLPEGKTTGDSWISSYFSYDGGGRWTSTLLPGYPQDMSPEGLASPLNIAGYEASAESSELSLRKTERAMRTWTNKAEHPDETPLLFLRDEARGAKVVYDGAPLGTVERARMCRQTSISDIGGKRL